MIIKTLLKKTENKEISFFDAPVFKSFKSFVIPKVTELINEAKVKLFTSDQIETVTTDKAISNDDFLNRVTDNLEEIKEIDIKVDFLGGDTLIIDKSLEIVNNEFDLETKIDDILDNLLTDDSLDISINAKGIELFTTSSLSQTSENTELEEGINFLLKK